MLQVEQLETRLVPAVYANFAAGVLTVLGDSAANSIAVSADANGGLQVSNNGNAVNIRTYGATPDVAATNLITIDGRAGNDTITTARSLNVLDGAGKLASSPNTFVWGGDGHDLITIGHGGFLGGVIGGPTAGNAFVDGGRGNDTINSGFGNDTILGGAGDDTYFWLPGTLTDSFDGGTGNDTAVIIGNNNADDVFALVGQSDGTVRFDRVNLVPFTVLIDNAETISLLPGSGNDTVIIGDLTGAADLVRVLVDGGAGDDVIDASGNRNTGVVLLLSP
jgi:Ca2+-binding RTX toxin-like protein